MSSTATVSALPARTDADLAQLRREIAARKAAAVADGVPHKAGDEVFVIGYTNGKPIEARVCVRCGYTARDGKMCADAERYVRWARSDRGTWDRGAALIGSSLQSVHLLRSGTLA